MTLNQARCFESFDQAFVELSQHLDTIEKNCIYDVPMFVSAPRDLEIKEQLCVAFGLRNPRNRLLAVPARKFSTEYLAAELVWYLSGNNKLEWIGRHASFWEGIANADRTINSAYGYRIFVSHDGKPSQWQRVKEELKKDPDSRRAIIHIKSESDSLDSADVPCTLSLQFFIRNKKLYLQTHMRSNDLILGLSYDLPAFTIMQEMMAIDLGVELGTYFHSAGSLHVYQRHYDMLKSSAGTPLKNTFSQANVDGNKSMNPLSVISSDLLLSEAKFLANWDLTVLERSETSDDAMASLLRVLNQLQTSLMRDCARLLTTSFLKRYKKTLLEKTSLLDGAYLQTIDTRRENIVKGLEDTSLRICTR